MTEKELAAIEARHQRWERVAISSGGPKHTEALDLELHMAMEDVPALLAEVRRLQAALKELRESR